MKFVALVSGGKDSVYSISRLVDSGHELVALLHMRSTETYVDSYMYQTVGSELGSVLGECLGVPMFVHSTACRSINRKLVYRKTEHDEVEDLYDALLSIKATVSFEGVSSGAILSTYQKNRVESVCQRLGVQSLAPLWQIPQKSLLERMIRDGVDARVVKVASSFLDRGCINMSLSEVREHLESKAPYETNYCGEGGEYESVVLDCPLFRKRIVVDEYEIEGHPDEAGREGSVFFMRIRGFSLVDK
jgi:diphthine-ammonia ligase